MKPIAIFYATREGHTAKIAEHLATAVRDLKMPAETINVAHMPRDAAAHSPLRECSAVIIAASVHAGKHEREMVDFVKQHAQTLGDLPSIFLSVSLSEVTVEDPNAPDPAKAKADTDVHRLIDEFLDETGWQPGKIQAVAGALLYSKYNFLMRFVMKRIARASGGPTDTTHDYDFTDWTALDHLAEELVAAVRHKTGKTEAATQPSA